METCVTWGTQRCLIIVDLNFNINFDSWRVKGDTNV